MKSYRWLLFDADGTLFDYDRAETAALENTFRLFGLDILPEHHAVYRRVNARLWREFEEGRVSALQLRVQRFADLAAECGLAVDPEQMSPAYLTQLSRVSVLLPGAEAVVRRLAARYQLALITNGLKEVQRPRLEGSVIAEYFQAVAISDEMGVAKPDPRYFDMLFGWIGQPDRSEVLVIGDNLGADILGGLNSGLDTCWYNPAHRPANPAVPATYEVARLEELLVLLGLETAA